MKSSTRRPAPREKKLKRVNLNIPVGLYEEALRLVDYYHFPDLTTLIHHLIREAAFKERDPRSLMLNENSTDNPAKSSGRSSGN